MFVLLCFPVFLAILKFCTIQRLTLIKGLTLRPTNFISTHWNWNVEIVFQNFQVACKNATQVIAPGLEMTALVEYHNKKDEDCKDQIMLIVDETVVHIPLIA